MSVHSGKFGVVNNASTVRNWSVVDMMTLSEVVASNTKGGKARRRGIHDWNGSFSGFGGTPPVMPGELFTFQGYTAPDDDASGNGVVYEGPAIVENVQIVWNWSNGEVISWSASIAGDGPIVAGSDEFTDESAVDAPEVCGRKIEFLTGATGDGTGVYTEWTNLVQATLQISSANQAYTNSSTIFTGACWQRRKPGIIDWNLSVQEQDNIRSRFAKGDDLFLKLYTATAEFWWLALGRVKEFTGLTVDRESGGILSQTVNLDMNGIRDSDGFDGFVVRPSGEEFWPTFESSTTLP